MAINPNDKLLNQHCAFLGGSGSGKTWKVKERIHKNKKANVMLFDSEEVYGKEVVYFNDFKKFAACVIKNHKAGARFKLGYSGKQSDFNAFCKLAWLIADGNRELLTIFEECGGYLGNGASTDDYWYKLISIGRKYNISVLPVSQRPQNMSKVLFDNCNTKWLGYSMGKAKNYLESEFKIDMNRIEPESYAYYLVNAKGIKFYNAKNKEVKS